MELECEVFEVEPGGEWYWICICPRCGGLSSGDEIDLDARRAYGPFKSRRAAYNDAKANAEGRDTKYHKQWRRKYLAGYLAEYPEIVLEAVEPVGSA